MPESDLQRLSRLVLDEFARIHQRFDHVDAEFLDLRQEIRTIRQQLSDMETAVKNLGGFSKEIDHLLGRIAAIEKHLGLHESIAA